jgi:hypothetical protein
MKGLLFPIAAVSLALVTTGRCGEPPAIDFALISKSLPKGEGGRRFPKALADLEGKKVRITGFVSPYDEHVLRLKKFILTPAANPGCYSCNPPEETGVVFARVPAKGPAITWKSNTLAVEGTLHLKGRRGEDEESSQFLVTLDDAVVIARK